MTDYIRLLLEEQEDGESGQREEGSWRPKEEGLALPLCRMFGAARRRFRRSSPYTPARRMSFARPSAEIFQLMISSLSGASARYCFRVTAVI